MLRDSSEITFTQAYIHALLALSRSLSLSHSLTLSLSMYSWHLYLVITCSDYREVSGRRWGASRVCTWGRNYVGKRTWCGSKEEKKKKKKKRRKSTIIEGDRRVRSLKPNRIRSYRGAKSKPVDLAAKSINKKKERKKMEIVRKTWKKGQNV